MLTNNNGNQLNCLKVSDISLLFIELQYESNIIDINRLYI